MTRRRLIGIACVLLVGGTLLLMAEPPVPPRIGLVLECRFRSWGNVRTLKVRNGDGAIVVAPGSRIQLAMYLKSEAMDCWRKTSCIQMWSTNWRGGPNGPAGSVAAFVAPQRSGAYCVRHVAEVEYRGNGHWPALWRKRRSTAQARLFLLVPVSRRALKNGRIGAYQIGKYPSGTSPPSQFIQIEEQSAGAFVSPHYRLDDFACRDGGYPKYAPFDYALVDKLEAVSDELRRGGYLRTALRVYSVYRTPRLNAAVSGASRSYHMWGKAADGIVDEDRDGLMDDLDRDGKVDIHDAVVIGRIVRRLERQGNVKKGGTGVYEYPTSQGGFGANVHIDVRGSQARWGRHYFTPGHMEHWRTLHWGP